ncbi:hypothetical protein [Massilia sp. erpn]|uniref:hypothetical protein n=1 Tax=Massilia sp. erpn TaxID=2738142 RepID=UPI0021033F10|nr:hypothetical protein [Massilia sp. erpn]UTY56354.1 hypothetical protein HPQ68_03585 [Massilia sp. erpn]
MLKKIAFFIFALALGGSYALAANEECVAQCREAYDICMENGFPKPPTCARNLQRCLSYCNTQ